MSSGGALGAEPGVTDQHKATVQAQFGAGADAYVQSAGHAGGDDLDRLVQWGRQRGAGRVLDIATGGGHTALAFARFTPTVVATDLTLPMLSAARSFILNQGIAGAHFLAADAEALPFRDESFGVVTCRIAAHHFPQLPIAIRQVARVLRRGGSFLVEDIRGHDDPEAAAFLLEVERRRDPTHVRSFRQLEWTAFLRACGLTVIDEATMSKVRVWEQWTTRARMSDDAKAALERFVREAPTRCLEAFQFELDGDRIVSFTDRMLLLRADKD
ncbi:MAG TPA: class I SAM-dependent methyltransferase [Candidatus Methylomirabilis sp.]|nr:class I SAM-dependent methyltransferase [Candidatus Methylomirabilis sp.]